MLRSTLWRPATSLVLCGLLAACADSAYIGHVADKTPVEAQMGETTHPVMLSKVVQKLKRGEDIGAIQTGLMCLPDEDLVHRGRDSRYLIEDEEYTEVFREELEAANYEVVGDPDALFEDPSEWKAQYKIAGLIKKIRANICYPWAAFGNYETGTAEATMDHVVMAS